jgi:glycerol uptake facilitator protein
MFGKRKIATLVAEFLGTGALTLVILSVQRSTIGVPYFVGIAGGLAVALYLLTLGSVSGSHLNPAITLALWTARKVETLTAAMYIIVQLLGAWAAYGIYTYFVNSSLQTIGGHFTARVLIAEGIGTFIFAFAWAAVTARRYTAGVVAAATGLAFALGLIVAASVSVGLINPALALGTRAWDIWGSMGWGTYVLGPVVGAVLGVNLYKYVFEGTEEVVVAAAQVSSASSTSARSTRATAARKTTSRTKKTTSKKR